VSASTRSSNSRAGLSATLVHAVAVQLRLGSLLAVVAAELLAFGHFAVASRVRALVLLLSLYLGHGTLLQVDYPADRPRTFTLPREIARAARPSTAPVHQAIAEEDPLTTYSRWNSR
jgi:hypothetical protein